MAITFKGERTVAELNNNLGGFVKDSAFRIYDHGTLLKGNVPVKHGDFVSWTGTQWKIEPSLEYATSADVEAIEEQIESIGQPLQWKGPATVAELNAGITGIQEGWTYTLTDAGTLTDGSMTVDAGDEVAWTEDGEWFKLGGEGGAKVYTVTYDSETTTWNYPTFTQISADISAGKFPVLIVTNPALASEVYKLDAKTIGQDAGFYFSSFTNRTKKVLKISSDDSITNSTVYDGGIFDGGALTDGATVDVPNNSNSTLSSSQAALTLRVYVYNGEVPNFAVEITAGTDITLTVVKTNYSTGVTTTLNYSAAAGNTLENGKIYQVTCVGNCWTLAEFMVPTP